MLDIEKLSIKRKIQTSRDINNIIEDMICGWDGWPLELYFAIKSRLLNGYVLEEMAYAKIVALSKSKTLYDARGYFGMNALHHLFTQAIPDPKIEIKICENVEKEYYSRIPTYLRESLKVLAQHGSVVTLNYLEPIAFDNAAELQVTKIKQNLFSEIDFSAPENQDYLMQFESISTSLKSEIFSELFAAIEAIKKRNRKPEERFVEWSTI